jgi:DNA (cytosine-5)-methyltransferase 1
MILDETLAEPWTVADFFSCGGGTSAGFSTRPCFRIVGAVDLQLAKPSGGNGASDCNATYTANHGVIPLEKDMRTLESDEFAKVAGIQAGQLNVMISCAPCTHLSRTNPENHLVDKADNTLIGRSGEFAAALMPEVFFMENARELIMGNYRHHHAELVRTLERAKYDVRSDIHLLDRFGPPQVRERALVIASRIGTTRTLEDLWSGWTIRPEVVTVRTALSRLAEWQMTHPHDPDGDIYPGITADVSDRIAATPKNGGGWIDVARNRRTRKLLTRNCLRRWREGDFGSHPDVYGRMAWDKPAPTPSSGSARMWATDATRTPRKTVC